MATLTQKPIRPYICRDGIKYTDAGEEASQDYIVGCPLVADATSKEGEEWAGGTDATTLLGFAAGPAIGTAGSKQGYYEATSENLFEGTLVSGTSTVALAATHLGTRYSLVEDATTQNWYVDAADETTIKVQVVGIGQGSAIGDYNARVIFRVVTDMQANVLASS